MWVPPWARSTAFGALPDDTQLARETAEHVWRNVQEGRAFYDPQPPGFEAWFRQHGRGLHRYLSHHPLMAHWIASNGGTADTADIEKDTMFVINRTYYNALRGIGGYRGDGKLSSWVYAIAHDAMIDVFRVRSRMPEARNRILTMSMDGDSDEENAASMQAAAEAAVLVAARQTAESEGTDDEAVELSRQKLFKKLRETIKTLRDAGRDRYGLPLLASKDAKILTAWMRAGGDMDRTARALGVSSFGARTLVTSAIRALEAKYQAVKGES